MSELTDFASFIGVALGLTSIVLIIYNSGIQWGRYKEWHDGVNLRLKTLESTSDRVNTLWGIVFAQGKLGMGNIVETHSAPVLTEQVLSSESEFITKLRDWYSKNGEPSDPVDLAVMIQKNFGDSLVEMAKKHGVTMPAVIVAAIYIVTGKLP